MASSRNVLSWTLALLVAPALVMAAALPAPAAGPQSGTEQAEDSQHYAGKRLLENHSGKVTSTRSANGSTTETFSVIGTLPIAGDNTVSPVAVANKLRSSGSAPTMITMATSPVLYQWSDTRGRTVILRKNVNEKIVTKHNVNYRVARATTKYPERYWFVSGSKWQYETPVHEVQCSGWWIWRSCKIKRTLTVVVPVDFRKLGDGRAYGVVTTYCKGMTLCPDFVKNALNI